MNAPALVMQAAKGRLDGGGLRAVGRIGGQTRALWNLFTAENATRYKADGKFVFYPEMSAPAAQVAERGRAAGGSAAPCGADDGAMAG